jgi:hypothetical protein
VKVPDFDPFDGGTGALVLFLFEKPGPMSIDARFGSRYGSGFMSRDNDDPAAEATYQFLNAAGLPRTTTVLWNTVPWWNGSRKIIPDELRAGAQCVSRLIGLLPKLRVVVLVGQKADIVRPYLAGRNLTILRSDHPSPLVRARWPHRWQQIPLRWTEAKLALS